MTIRFRCIDGEGMAQQRRAELAIERDRAALLGHEAVRAVAAGHYLHDGRPVDWSGAVAAAGRSRASIPPDESLPALPAPTQRETVVTVANLTSLSAAHDQVRDGRRPLVLNMANGVTPGGGFQSGARAQEEYLCRASALHATLAGDPMYATHRRRADHESTSAAIMSPDVPVFRDDAGLGTIPTPWLCSFVTMAAPVAQRVGQPRSRELMAQRIDRLLGVAACHGYRDLVLGAWGCGAFGNDPDHTAQAFRDALTGRFAGRFGRVDFAITDWSPDRRFLGPFCRWLGA